MSKKLRTQLLEGDWNRKHSLLASPGLISHVWEKPQTPHTPLIQVAPCGQDYYPAVTQTLSLIYLAVDKDVHPEPLGNLGFDMKPNWKIIF